ncbi:MAG TPA: ABC transporter transmembrane domain-containing protein [Solirubrobacteraceae bacterium]|nr:ABC transporter transmembrane domain-containing protein [Solirubrobacteraceae bacterium]
MSPAARILRPYITRQWKALAGAGGSTVLLTLADLAKPWPLALVVDHLLSRQAPFDLTASDWRLLILVAAIVLAIAVAEAVSQYLCDLWLQSAGERITHELRIAAYDHLQRLSLGFHHRRQKGDLVTRVTGDVDGVGTLFSQQLGEVVQSALLAFGMVVVVMVIDPVLGLISIATLPLMLLMSSAFRRRVKAQSRVRRAQDGQIASLANEALSSMAVVKAFGSERYEADRVRSHSEERLAAGVQVARLQARFDGLVGAVRALGTAVVIVAGVMRVAAGAIGPGDLIVFVSYTRKAHNPMRSIAREATKIAAAMAKAERVAELLAEDEVLEERPGAFHGGRARGEIALEDVSFAYGGERPALRDVTLHVDAGERVALMGASGAGKSTLGALIARFYDPTEGRVMIDGRDARDCSLGWLRDQVAIVLQDTVLFTGSVRDNIAYGCDDVAPERIEEVARAAAAHEFISELPERYDTQLGPQGVGLSGGQRQRIGIARTLLRNPPILLLDEPTTGLDADSEASVLEGLASLMEGRTTLLVTHSQRLADTADRIVRLEHGNLAPTRRSQAPDPALPQLELLLDGDAMRDVLAGALHPGAELGGVDISRVVYKPGDTVAVHYRAEVDGERCDAVATSMAGVALAESARKPRYRALAQRADGRSPADPISYDAAVGTLITWLPFDPRLPALVLDGNELADTLGVDGGELELIGYKPRSRAVLRLGDHVLKAYGRERQYEAALAGLMTAAREGPLPTAAFTAAAPDLRLTAQHEVAGERPPAAADVAERAGALVATLQHAELPGLSAAPPERQLAAAARKADVIRAVLPSLAPRLDGLVARLSETQPANGHRVAAHGDFHVDQLLLTADGIAVIDFDQMCVAAPALDLATYAADVVRGRDSDLEEVHAVLQPLLAGYGDRPDDLQWHLAAAILGRAAHPFHRQVPDWRRRVELMVTAAEEVEA